MVIMATLFDQKPLSSSSSGENLPNHHKTSLAKTDFLDPESTITVVSNVGQNQSATKYTPRGSQNDHLRNAQTEPVSSDQPTQPTSPASNSLSQPSQNSQAAVSPSTAPSSIAPDHEMEDVSVSNEEHLDSEINSKHSQPVHAKNVVSRSPSVASVDGASRSSGRTRKPTSKALALADTGTRLFRDLRRSSEAGTAATVVAETSPTRTYSEIDQTLDCTQESTYDAITEVPSTTIDTTIIHSVESTSPTSIRSSSRQRKPTAKAAAADNEASSRKRTASPLDGERATKMHRTGTNTPREPSKLRTSLSSVEDEFSENTPISAKPAISKTKAISTKSIPSPATKTASRPRSEEKSTDASVAKTLGVVNGDLVDLSPEHILLAFARYAANDAESDINLPDKRSERDDQHSRYPEAAESASPKMAKELIVKILDDYRDGATKIDPASDADKSSAHRNVPKSSQAAAASKPSSTSQHSKRGVGKLRSQQETNTSSAHTDDEEPSWVAKMLADKVKQARMRNVSAPVSTSNPNSRKVKEAGSGANTANASTKTEKLSWVAKMLADKVKEARMRQAAAATTSSETEGQQDQEIGESEQLSAQRKDIPDSTLQDTSFDKSEKHVAKKQNQVTVQASNTATTAPSSFGHSKGIPKQKWEYRINPYKIEEYVDSSDVYIKLGGKYYNRDEILQRAERTWDGDMVKIKPTTFHYEHELHGNGSEPLEIYVKMKNRYIPEKEFIETGSYLQRYRKARESLPTAKLDGLAAKATSGQRRSLILGSNTKDESPTTPSAKRNPTTNGDGQEPLRPSSTREGGAVSAVTTDTAEKAPERSLKITLKVRALPE